MRYKIVFSVDILHEYYTNLFCQDFEIVPSAATAAVLRGHGMLWKSIGHKLIVLTRTDNTGKPVVSLDSATKLSFYLRLNNPHFNNFTSLNYLPSGTFRYYFSNINQTKITTTNYLSSKIATYNNSTDYGIGSFASNAANDVFEAIKPNNSGSAHALSEVDFWLKRGKFQYVNSDDLMEITPFVYQFVTTAATNFAVTVFAFNAASGNYDLQAMDPVNLTFSTPQTTVPVRLETLPAGKYKVDVNGSTKFIYFDADVAYKGIFGLIEIFNHLPGTNAFALFDAAGLPKSTTFTIRFANRSVVWKYLSRTADVTAVEDTAANISFAAEPGNQFISQRPVPMQEKPLTTILLKSTLFGDVLHLANPGKDRLATLVKDGNTYLCSELHLNY